jgi:hypothetical protein
LVGVSFNARQIAMDCERHDCAIAPCSVVKCPVKRLERATHHHYLVLFGHSPARHRELLGKSPNSSDFEPSVRHGREIAVSIEPPGAPLDFGR